MRASRAGPRPASRSTPHAASTSATVGCESADGGKQVLATLRRKCQQSFVDERAQRLRQGQRLTRLDGDSRAAQHAHDLEGVERVPARRLVNLREQGTRQRDSEVLVDHAVQRAHLERPDVHVAEAIGAERAPQLDDERALERSPAREQQSDRLAAQASRAVRERGGRRGVEPLRVVDGDEQRRLGRERPQGVERGDADRTPVWRRPLGVLQHQRERERAPLWIAAARQAPPRRPAGADRRAPRRRTSSRSPPAGPGAREALLFARVRRPRSRASSSPRRPRPEAREPPRRPRRSRRSLGGTPARRPGQR